MAEGRLLPLRYRRVQGGCACSRCWALLLGDRRALLCSPLEFGAYAGAAAGAGSTQCSAWLACSGTQWRGQQRCPVSWSACVPTCVWRRKPLPVGACRACSRLTQRINKGTMPPRARGFPLHSPSRATSGAPLKLLGLTVQLAEVILLPSCSCIHAQAAVNISMSSSSEQPTCSSCATAPFCLPWSIYRGTSSLLLHLL